MRPRFSKKFRSADSPRSPLTYKPHPGPPRPHHLTKPSGIQPLVYLNLGETLTQQPCLPWLPGQVGFAGDRPQDGELRPAPVPDNVDDHWPHMFSPVDGDIGTVDAAPVPTRHRRKRANQTARWTTEVIPRLILPYMEYMHQTLSLRNQGDDLQPICVCNQRSRSLEIAVVRFSGASLIIIQLSSLIMNIQFLNLWLFILVTAHLSPSSLCSEDYSLALHWCRR